MDEEVLSEEVGEGKTVQKHDSRVLGTKARSSSCYETFREIF